MSDRWTADEETGNDVLSPSVGDSSVRTEKRTCFVIARFAVCHFESSSHNPEVVGSNPAPATRQKHLFSRENGCFSNFLGLNANARIRGSSFLVGVSLFYCGGESAMSAKIRTRTPSGDPRGSVVLLCCMTRSTTKRVSLWLPVALSPGSERRFG